VLHYILAFINQVFDILFAPLPFLDPILFLGLLAFISAIVILYIFKKVSNQGKIKFHKNRIIGYILEINLYRDDFGQIISSLLNVLKHNMFYLRYVITPLLVIMIPMIPVMMQINNRLGYMPLNKNEQFIIRIELDKDLAANMPHILEKIICETSEGIHIETPPLRVVSEASIFWRARILNSNRLQYIHLKIEGVKEILEKQIVTNSEIRSFTSQKTKRSLWNSLLYGAEDPIPETFPVQLVSVSYRPARYSFLFLNSDPIMLFFIFTLCFGLIIKPFIGVRT